LDIIHKGKIMKILKHIIFKIKFYYYTNFINRIVNYIVLLLRNDVDNQNIYDKKTDSHLREIVLKELFPKISNHITDIDVDNEYLIELTNKISLTTHDIINQIKEEYSLHFDALDELPDKYFDEDEYEDIKDFYNVTEVIQRFDNIKIKPLINSIRKYQSGIKKLRKPISERNAIKYFIKFEYFSKALTIGTPILLIGGIFKQYIISSDFLFPLPTVFSLNDYISASIDTLIFAIIPTLIFIFAFYIGVHENSRIDLIYNKRDKIDVLVQYLNYLLIFSLTIYTYFKNKIDFYFYLPFASLYLIGFILPNLLRRYVKYNYNLTILIFSILFFYLNIYSNTKSETFKIKSNKVERHFEFELSENIKDINNLRYVTAGANYYVFWDAKDSTTILIKKENIKKIIIK